MPHDRESVFQLLAEHSADVICRVGLDMKLIYVSPSSLRVLGWSPEEMIAMPPFGTVLAEDIPTLAAAAGRHLEPGVEPDLVSARVLRKDGTIAWMEVSARVVRDSVTQEARETIIIMRDITERKMMEEQLARLAFTDDLTGLGNRRAFDQALDREWNRTLREGSHISLLLLDLDHFKRFNDMYGHQVGDDCLRTIAIAVKRAVRASDLSARYGGEEIAVILPGTESSKASEIAERVRLEIENLGITHEGNLEGGNRVTASIGVATALARCGGTMRMPESLLLAADNALYRAKHEGRNRIAKTLLVAPHEG